ncbi:hypothetical protein Bca52824_027545 [Brassica carinata]|uniref:Cystinosin n=1 Tax=Brassica carinata TaxID=52824 RepID=A0A8X8AQE2_BRACI|nr:hypothetical protein Bca52824_027545 [Brassica carinata]
MKREGKQHGMVRTYRILPPSLNPRPEARQGALSAICIPSPIPQAKMNFTRKSTVGWSIGNILLDFGGGLANYLQMVIQSIDQNSWVNFYGNIGKTLLSLISIFFDILFMFQHYVLYPEKKASKSVETGEESNEPLMDPSHEHV